MFSWTSKILRCLHLLNIINPWAPLLFQRKSELLDVPRLEGYLAEGVAMLFTSPSLLKARRPHGLKKRMFSQLGSEDSYLDYVGPIIIVYFMFGLNGWHNSHKSLSISVSPQKLILNKCLGASTVRFPTFAHFRTFSRAMHCFFLAMASRVLKKKGQKCLSRTLLVFLCPRLRQNLSKQTA